MPEMEIDSQEAGITQLAVQALTSANQRAIHSGRSVLVVINDALVRIGSSGNTVLKKLPPRRKVATRIKRSSK